MRKRWVLVLCLVGTLTIGFLSCSDPDPLLGSWHLSYGTTVTFSRGGRLDGHVTGSSYTWEGTWERQGERLLIVAPKDEFLSQARTYLVAKVTDHELVLKAAGTGEIVSGTRLVS